MKSIVEVKWVKTQWRDGFSPSLRQHKTVLSTDFKTSRTQLPYI